MNSVPHRRRVAVVGGGISGLAAAHRLVEVDPNVELTLFEAAAHCGGLVQTQRERGYLLEQSADSFVTNVPWALDLCRRIGLADELIETNAVHRRALVVHNAKLYRVPDGFTLLAAARAWPIVSTPLLSVWGKLRLLGERFVPRRRGGPVGERDDESLASFARRRLGREAFERLVQPLVAGIYTADAEKLSMAAALPQFVEMEQRYGSLLRALRRGAADEGAGARYSLFVSFREGLATLVEALVKRLPEGSLMLNMPVERIAPRPGGGWTLSLAGRNEPREFDAVIVATSALLAARLLAGSTSELAAELGQIPYASSAIALAGYAQEQFARPLEGFGLVVPEVEKRQILAASFSSVKFPGRAPAGRVLVRVFFGGSARPEQVDLADDELRRITARELGELLGLRGEPELFRVRRWPASMPQYHLGHLARVARIEALVERLPGLALAGNAYRGVGIPHCIRSGEVAAEKVSGVKSDE